MFVIGVLVVVRLVVVRLVVWLVIDAGGSWFVLLGRAFDDFVEFTAIEPDATALRTIIDFYAASLGHGEGHITGWTLHGSCV